MLLFSTKTKQIPLSFGLGGIKQMKTKHLFSFTTKPKQIAFTFLSAGTKQIKTNGILPFSTKTNEKNHVHVHISTTNDHMELFKLRL